MNWFKSYNLANTQYESSLRWVVMFLFIIFLIISNYNTVLAGTGINAQIPYSGTIIKNDGIVLADGGYRAKFLIYNLSSGGESIYEEIRDGSTTYSGVVSPLLSVVDGRFEILLGSQNTTLSSINDDSLWVELQLDADGNGSYEEVFSPRKRIGSAMSAINSLRLVANGGSSTNTLALDSTGNLIATSLSGVANTITPIGFDRVLLANSSGQFSQVALGSISGSSGWALAGNVTTDAWNGTSGTRLGTTSAQPLVLATTNATAQDIRFFTGANGVDERMRITGAGNIIVNSLGGSSNTTTPGGFDRVLLANSSGQFSQVGISSLGSGIWASQSDFSNLQSEIFAARGDRSSLNLRISTISNFASPNAGANIVGQYYDNAFQANASATLVGAANRLDLAPFYTSQPLKIDQIGISVGVAATSALAKIVIYNSDSNGWPDQLVYQGDSDLDCSTTGYKFHTLDFKFDSGRQYWIGVIFNSNLSIRAINLGSAVNLGINGSTGENYFTVLRRTITYGDNLPSSWNFVTGDRAANVNPPSIRMRAAALP